MQLQQVCVGGLIKDLNGEILFVKRSDTDTFMPGLWELPGGGTDYGEVAQEALKREIKEECGLDIVAQFPISVHEYYIKDGAEEVQRVEITFLCKLSNPSQQIMLSNEHSEYKWVAQNDINTLELSDYMKALVDEAIQNPLVINS